MVIQSRSNAMKHHYPELERVCEVMDNIPHAKCQNLANSIRTCNSVKASYQEKTAAVLVAALQFL